MKLTFWEITPITLFLILIAIIILFADKANISISFGKLYFSSINGLGSDDVRLSKRRSLGSKKLRGFEKGKVGPVDGTDHIGGNYATALNFEVNLPNFLPENTGADIGFFLDFGNVWGVDYSDTLGESNKIRSTFGLNTSWISPAGPMSFIFSQNISPTLHDIYP